MSTSSVVADLVDDAREFLDGGTAELTELLEGVAAYGDRPAPAPSAELALLLAGRPAATAPGRATPARVRTRRLVAGLAAAAVSALSVTGAAAVANELPVPVQRAVAHFSEQFLPFSFPRPAGDRPAGRDATSTRPGPGRDLPSGSPADALPGTADGTSTQPGSRRPGTQPGGPGSAGTAHVTRGRTGPHGGTTSHPAPAPSAGSSGGGAQARGTTPAAPARSRPDPVGASPDPAAGDVRDGAHEGTPGPRKDPSGPAPKSRAHTSTGGTGDTGKDVRATTPDAEGGGSGGTGRWNGAGAHVKEPKAADASAAAAATGPARSAAASGGHDAATQDGSGAPTP